MLREAWEGSRSTDESVISYMIATQEKLKAMADLMQENMTKAQKNQKQWYDKKARLRQFAAGDPVLKHRRIRSSES